MDRDKVRALRVAVENALKGLNDEKHVVSIGGASFGSTSVTFKIEVAEKDAGGQALTREARALQELGQLYGLPKDSLGKAFVFRGEQYVAIGMAPKSGKYPILGKRVRDNKVYKFPPTVLGGKALYPDLAAEAKAEAAWEAKVS